MRRAAASCLLATLLLTTGCGYVGDPLPPALNIPERITDLQAKQRGDRILIDFTMPVLTTEGLPVRNLRGIDLRIGPAKQPFDTGEWFGSSKPIPIEGESGTIHTEMPATEWSGRDAIIGVRLLNANGRPSDWSNMVSVSVVPAVATPFEVRAQPTAKGILVTWKAPAREGVRFRVSRHASDEKQYSALATVDGNQYVDSSVILGRHYQYVVQAVVGDSAESETGSPATATATDLFAPAAPRGATAVAALNSIELGWERNAEPDIAYYRVYRAEGDGALSVFADRVENPAFSDRQVTGGKRYRYAISAVDGAGNEGEQTAPVQAVAP
jgi:hypothetical protein